MQKTQLAVAVEYTDCISAHKECPVYDSRASNGKAEALRNVEYTFITITPRFTLIWSGSAC